MLIHSEKVLSSRIPWYSICRRFCVQVNTNDSLLSLEPHNDQENNKSNKKVDIKDRKCLKISILGTPNAGKSTLINQLVKRAVCAASSKVHTTQVKAEGIYTEGNTQLVFVDTPGLVPENVHKKYKLQSSFQIDPRQATNKADIIGIVQDASNKHTRNSIDQSILDVIEEKNIDVPKILILNKIDEVKRKHVLLGVVREINKKHPFLVFNDIFMVSAIIGDGVDDLKNYLLDLAKPQDWHYEDGVYTDQIPEDIVLRTIRAELMNDLPNELPYRLKLELEDFHYCMDGSVSTTVKITCPTKRTNRLLLGLKGIRIRSIAKACEEQLRVAFYSPVVVKLNVTYVQKE